MTNRHTKFVSSKNPVSSSAGRRKISSSTSTKADHQQIKRQKQNHSGKAAELTSIYEFLIHLCLSGSNPLEQRSIARYILSQLISIPELEYHSGIYSFLSTSKSLSSNNSITTIPSSSRQNVLQYSPRKSTTKTNRNVLERKETTKKIGSKGGKNKKKLTNSHYGSQQHQMVQSTSQQKQETGKRKKSTTKMPAIMINSNIIPSGKGNGAEMLQRLFRAIEFTDDALTAIVLCRLLQGFVKNSKMAVAQRRLRLCAKLDGTSHCLRAIKAKLERQKYIDDRLLPNGMSIGQFALDYLARTLLCVAVKDRKFALKIRLNGILPTLAVNVLLPLKLDAIGGTVSPIIYNSINLLRLTVRCLRSSRNAQIICKERNFAQRFVFTLNFHASIVPNLLEDKSSNSQKYLIDQIGNQFYSPKNINSSNSAGHFLLPMAEDGPKEDDELLLLSSMLANSNAAGGNVEATKMARLMEGLFFLTKIKRNKSQLLDHQCLPVLKTIFETNFQRRRQDLVHQEIALIALASLRQFAKTKKGRDQLISLSTLDMCEMFIAEMAKEEEEQNKMEKGKPTADSSNLQLQDSLCALCLRCLPAQQFPYGLDKFPIKFALPKPLSKMESKEQRKSTTLKQKNKKSIQSPKSRQQERGEMDDDEEEDGHSSDEDYGFWSTATTGAEIDLLGEDSMMSCSGGNLIGGQIDYNEEDKEDEENLKQRNDSSGKPPLGSALAVEQYNRQQPVELIMNYQKMFAEINRMENDSIIPDELASTKMINQNSPEAILSLEQIVRQHWMTDPCHRLTRSIVPLIKIAYPELLDVSDKLMGAMASFGNATNSTDEGIQFGIKAPTEKNDITASPESMRQLIVQKMTNHYRSQQQESAIKNEFGNDALFKRHIVYDLDELAEHMKMPLTLNNKDAEYVSLNKGGNSHMDHLQFESRFESGNLRKAIQTGPTEYELVLSPDINQQSPHFQWFYFEVSGMRPDLGYTFEIVNCLKSVSMFSRGMQPVLFSVAEAVRHGRPGWTRAGTQISYFRNLYAIPEQKSNQELKLETNAQNDECLASSPRRRTRSATMANTKDNLFGSTQNGKKDLKANKIELENRNFFSLRFTLHFPYYGDICYIAYHFPYTYTRLQCTLERWISSNATGINTQIRRQILCHSLARVPIPLLTITNFSNSKLAIASRQIILITARVHPGETNSSWIMHGLIQFLLSNHPLASRAKEHFLFKLIPMLNPDGVINGSHRCSLSGQDLNRVWNDPQPNLHPTIFHAKGILQYAVDVLQKRPFAFIDLHGHSRKANIFMYGNNPEESWRQSDHQQNSGGRQFSLLPEILDKISDSFALKDCAFSITKPKEYSARVACWRQFGLERVYTMESSYWGFDQGPKAGTQISIADLMRMGAELVEGLLQLWESTDSTKLAPMAAEVDDEE